MIVIDWEFSWLDHKTNSLVSLWAIDFLNPSKQFYGECRIWEGASYEKEALEINGFSVDDITDKNKMSLKELVISFDEFLKTCSRPQILVGQNPKSDLDFLRESYLKSWLNYTLWHRSIDLHTIVFMKHLQIKAPILIEKWNYKINLDESLKFVWIRGWEPRPHNALTWAKCEAEVLSRVLYGKKLLPEFQDASIPQYLKN